MKSVWRKIVEFFKTRKWANWIVLGVAIVILLVAVLVPILSSGRNRDEDSTSKESNSSVESVVDDSTGVISSDESSIEEAIVGSKGLEYELSWDGVYYIVKGIGTCEDTDLVIPSTYNGLTITTIGDYAFSWCRSLKSVSIPDGVTSIGASAFMDCSGLMSVVIPDSVANIGASAFIGTGYYNNESNWENCALYIGKHLVDIKGDISGVYTIKDGTLCIANAAFAKCNSLISVVIPDSVTSIGGSAFWECNNLISVVIPDSVTNIGDSAFMDCSSLMSVEISDSLTNIEEQMFYGCINLMNIEIPDNVTSIGHNAFFCCTSLASVVVPDSVTSIGLAFQKCSSLTNVFIGDSVTSIERYAFLNCNNLTNIEVSKNNSVYKSIDGDLYSKDGKTLIRYAMGKTATSFIIPDGVISIDMSAFSECSDLMNVIIPNSVIYIGMFAFESSALESIFFKGTLKEWNAIEKIMLWDFLMNATEVVCSDGVVAL